VRLVYDKRYWPAGPPFAVLTACLMMRILGITQFQYLLARAEVYRATWSYLAALFVQVALLIPLTTEFGTVGMAVSVMLSTTALYLTQTLLMRHLMPEGVGWWLKTLAWMTAGLGCVYLTDG
jgi:O-antigen/teichoic acid export membrane protein